MKRKKNRDIHSRRFAAFMNRTKLPTTVCIITPGQLGMNPRVVKEATALSDAGYSVHVIATKLADFIEPRDIAVINSASFSVERISFDRKWVRRTERALQLIIRKTKIHKAIRPLEDYVHNPFTRKLKSAVKKIPADLYIAHYVAALPAAAYAADLHGSPFAFDAEDYHLGDLPPTPQFDSERHYIKAIEGRYLPRAVYVSAASPGIAEAYKAQYDINLPTVLLNTFPLNEAPKHLVKKKRFPNSIYWFSQTIGPKRGLECAIEAIAVARSKPHLHLRGMPALGYERKLRGIAADFGVSHRFHIHAPETPQKMAILASRHNLGLVLELGHTDNRKIALTNKQFTYLLAGIPSILSDVPAHRAFAREAVGACELFKTEDPIDLARVIDDYLLNKEKLNESSLRAWELAQTKFNWDAEAPTIRDCVETALNKNR